MPDMEQLPALMGGGDGDARSFANEREILYQILFDMRRDINELKKIASQENVSYPMPEPYPPVVRPAYTAVHPEENEPAQYAAEVPEDSESDLPRTAGDSSRSLEEIEREAITHALTRNKGRRRSAARELKISERTLYRKIKEYGLE
jgi:DNA-binding NtrC family response regulator